MKKSLILTNKSENFRLAAGPLPGDSLSGRAVSDGPLRGGYITLKKHVILQTKSVVDFVGFSPTLRSPHPYRYFDTKFVYVPSIT